MNEQERAGERVSETTVGLGGAGEVTATRLGEQNTYNIYSLVPALQIQGDFTAELSGKGRSNTKKSHTFALKMAVSLNAYVLLQKCEARHIRQQDSYESGRLKI